MKDSSIHRIAQDLDYRVDATWSNVYRLSLEHEWLHVESPTHVVEEIIHPPSFSSMGFLLADLLLLREPHELTWN